MPKRIDAENQYIQPTHIAVVDGTIVLNDKGSSFTYYSIKFPLNTAKRNVFKIVNNEVQYKDDGITVDTMEVDSGVYCFLDDYGVQKYFNGSTSSDKCVALTSVGPLLTMYGPSSIEFWQKGNAESYQSWQRTSYTINKEQGLEAPYSLATVNHSQFCIGTGKANAKCVLMINDTNVQKISPLGFQMLAYFLEVIQLEFQIVLDEADGGIAPFLGGDEVIGRNRLFVGVLVATSAKCCAPTGL